MNTTSTRMKGLLIIGGLLWGTGVEAAPGEPPDSIAEAPVIRIRASRFFYQPERIIVKKGQPVVLAIEAVDRVHGFSIPQLGIRAELTPGQTAVVRFTPTRTGTLGFHCDIFCGSGHEEMAGEIVVAP